MVSSGALNGHGLKPCTIQRISRKNLRGRSSQCFQHFYELSGHSHTQAQYSVVGAYTPEYSNLIQPGKLRYCERVIDETNTLDDQTNPVGLFAESPMSAQLLSKSNNGSLLLCASTAVGVSFATAFGDLTGNHVFMCAFWSWLVAQVAKVFTAYYREGRWDYKVMFDSGGMPSSHTSLVVGLTTSIAHQYGLGSVHFPLALAFTLIVMYDAAGVRRHAGKQAEVLNKILADTFHGSPISNTKLKEVLGHSPLQVVCGAILGVLVGSFYMLKFSY